MMCENCYATNTEDRTICVNCGKTLARGREKCGILVTMN